MSPEEVSKIIADEISKDWQHTNLHGCDLQKCLVTPQRRLFSDARGEAKAREMWLVLEERPDTHSGYRIVFDEETREFGLAIEGKDGRDVCIGIYGSFIETFDGM